MSECVVRMEMPTSCEKCPACDYEEGNCLLADDRNTLPHNGKRRAWCPIICQLPEGHGDLIGREYAIAIACSGLIRTLQTTEGGEDWIRVHEVRESIKSAPTIVPAEAERSET